MVFPGIQKYLCLSIPRDTTLNQNVPNKELEKFITVRELIQCHTKKATKIATVAAVMNSELLVPSVLLIQIERNERK